MFHSFELAGVVVSLVPLTSDFLVESSYIQCIVRQEKKKKKKYCLFSRWLLQLIFKILQGS